MLWLQKSAKKLNEECYEFIEAITDYENIDYLLDNRQELFEHIIEELGDVLVVLMQFQELYGIPDKKIVDSMKQKIFRTIERVENERD